MMPDAVLMCLRAHLNRQTEAYSSDHVSMRSPTYTLAVDDAFDVVDTSEIEGLITHSDLPARSGILKGGIKKPEPCQGETDALRPSRECRP